MKWCGQCRGKYILVACQTYNAQGEILVQIHQELRKWKIFFCVAMLLVVLGLLMNLKYIC